ncbi:MAG: phosphotransferase family protein [Myxococcota bacterium]|nr:phosphotransferase family protein [Myxococcota bacterium]
METADDATFQRFVAWAEALLGGRLTSRRRQGERRSGGRPAWFLDFETPTGPLACYARMSRGEGQLVSKTFTLEREYRVLGALHRAGIRVPEVHGFCGSPEGILMECVPGDFDYTALEPGPERDALDRDFVSELVKLHALAVEPFAAIGLRIPETPEEFALADLESWERAYRAALKRPVPLVEFATRWLRRHVPSAPERPALIQGDTGPGQFLFEGSRVRAIIDWEFAHVADPLLDLAQVRTRDFYNPGADMAAWCRSYGELSGRAVELPRLRYYTVKSMLITPLALAGVVQNMVPSTDHAEWYAQDVCYKRATAEALAEAVGVELRPPELPDAGPGPAGPTLDLVEQNLRDEHRPALADDYSRYRLDLVRRLLTHVRNRDAWAADLEALEREDLGALLGRGSASPDGAEAALLRRIESERSEDDAALVAYLHRRSVREEQLWRGALGVGEHAVFQRIPDAPGA